MDEATGREALILGEREGSRYRLAAPRSTPAGLIGQRLGSRAGSSLEFMDHRWYHPGDDLRRIDWAAYARSERLHVKLYRDEVSPHLELLIDTSASMDLPDSAKGRATLAVAAAVARAAQNARFTLRAWGVGDTIEPLRQAVGVPSAWRPPRLETRREAGGAFPSMHGGALRPQSVRVLISDLLFDADPLSVLTPLATGAASMTVVQLLADADAKPPAHGNLRLVDSETGLLREVYMDAAAQNRYTAALARLRAQWDVACRRTGAAMVMLIAERLLDGWDLGPLAETGLVEPA